MYGVTTTLQRGRMIGLVSQLGLGEFLNVKPLTAKPTITTMETHWPSMGGVSPGGVVKLRSRSSVGRERSRALSRERSRSRGKKRRSPPPSPERPPRSSSPPPREGTYKQADAAASSSGAHAAARPGNAAGPFPRSLPGHPDVFVDFDVDLMDQAFKAARAAVSLIQDYLEEPQPNFAADWERRLASIHDTEKGNPSLCFTPGEKVKVVFCVTTFQRTEQLFVIFKGVHHINHVLIDFLDGLCDY